MSDKNHEPPKTSATEQQQQEALLLELEIILSTVKQIDTNLIRSIELLQNTVSVDLEQQNRARARLTGTEKQQIDINFIDMIKRNTATISNILETLDSL
ncbi:hypothetical protein HYPBUDRAFT_122695 [Hyphopichia burtonii NRRL Y-1933]|uniref:Uncharacterized protein n=1 Tax=Hyphopichia burtonii NRRL Y-1933 TaxID=984485 RepID=A0A1E4RKM9_9ASCO|nr:hypothetical protein HYPBUDRAFT_122695 [Hyphopichia burtonii NRRL Y-1933]ODV67819.1 hypothetical protein HYPBUDRAFT_122695 [Hyphopichia burtonii NRRL Y-1933]